MGNAFRSSWENRPKKKKEEIQYRTDFFGKHVLIGDEIVVCEPNYHNLTKAIVKRFTPKGLTATVTTGWDTARDCCYYDGQFILVEHKYKSDLEIEYEEMDKIVAMLRKQQEDE